MKLISNQPLRASQAFICIAIIATLMPIAVFAQSKEVVATVDGVKITAGDIDTYCKIMKIDTPSEDTRNTIRETLIDRMLLEKFLKEKKAVPDQSALDQQMGAFVSVADHTKQPLEELLAKRGLTTAELERFLSVDLKWLNFAQKTITPQQVKIYFEQNKNRFDGTRITARQIFWKLPQPMSDEALQKKLLAATAVRDQINKGEITFEDAAKTISEYPSGKINGGLMEDVAYFGAMPTAITQIAFATREGELSQPFVTPFGIHVLKVEKIKVGTFSLDDAYPLVFERMSQTLRENTVLQLRKDAMIERK